MPAIYRIHCQTCGPEKDIHILDGRRVLKQDNGDFIALCHPGEDFDLEKLGTTEEKALRESRLFIVRYKLCTECGALHEQRRHQFDFDSHAPVIAGILLFLAAIAFTRLPLYITLGAAVLLTSATYMIANRLVKNRWRNKNEKLRVLACQTCASAKLLTISDAEGKSLPCPACKGKNLAIIGEGIA